MSEHHHHRHGSIFAGRIMVGAGCLLVLAANGLVFRAAARPHPVPGLEVAAMISLLWMFAGAYGMCTRVTWTRSAVLGILYVGTLALFLTGIITVAMEDAPLAGHVKVIFFAAAVYLYVSLVLTHSRHVRRLTSRTWE